MNSKFLLALIPYILGLSTGQVMFKKVGMSIAGKPARDLIFCLATSPLFYVSILLYGALTILWIWLLSKVPLSYAYPFVLLSFFTTPLCAVFFLNEQLGKLYWIGVLIMIIGGLIITIETTK